MFYFLQGGILGGVLLFIFIEKKKQKNRKPIHKLIKKQSNCGAGGAWGRKMVTALIVKLC